MPRDIERGKAAGFRDYLTKPLDISFFLETIDRCLAGQENQT
jgi:CheY-like chemotaxis protein